MYSWLNLNSVFFQYISSWRRLGVGGFLPRPLVIFDIWWLREVQIPVSGYRSYSLLLGFLGTLELQLQYMDSSVLQVGHIPQRLISYFQLFFCFCPVTIPSAKSHCLISCQGRCRCELWSHWTPREIHLIESLSINTAWWKCDSDTWGQIPIFVLSPRRILRLGVLRYVS